LIYRFRVTKLKLTNNVKLAQLKNELVINRLNPHFIFNVLNSIQYYINTENRNQANHYLGVFADLLRKFLNSYSDEFHPLKDELTLIPEYVELEKMIKNDGFEFIVSVDSKIDNNSLFPTMLLQPLIENAINHGLSSPTPIIRLEFKKELDSISCILEDNGNGMQKEVDLKQSKGINLVEQRIGLLNTALKNKITITWENKSNGETGVKIKLSIPDISN